MVSRRGLLGASAGAAGAVVLAGCTGDVEAPKPFNPRDWASVREQFALPSGRVHLQAFVFASHPAPVRAAIERHRSGLDGDAVSYLHAKEAALDDEVDRAAAAYLGVPAARIAYTDSTTMGLALLYSGLRLNPGDEILTTEHDFYATHESLRLLAERSGVSVRRVRLYADPARASVDEIVGNLRGALTASTKVVAVTWVHSSTGVRLPIREMAAEVRQRSDALVCVDGVHGLGAVDVGPEAMDVDFLVSGTHKWLFGPRGTGIIYGSEHGWSRYRPVIPSFSRASIGNWMLGASQPVAPGTAATPGGYHSFEHRWALADAFAFHTAIGRDRVAARTAELARRLKDGLSGIKGITLRTPMSPDVSGGLVCCSFDGRNPSSVVATLETRHVLASTTPYRESYVRFGTSVATDEGQVDTALAAIRELV
jgi:selenocysteine lyase/cysteine desulfurase